jgi:catechol 2,3-dioxygenase-like lactoylglutathione lyase family enzyme
MDNFYGRAVFFVRDAARSLAFYRDVLGFSLEWQHEVDGHPLVFEVSLFGCQLILNQTDRDTAARAGHGRVFVGLDEAQSVALRRHIESRRIATTTVNWGRPTLVIHDPDANELFFWLGPDPNRSPPP